MDNNKELNDLIAEMRSKLGNNARVELIGDDDQAREQQRRPGQALPNELLTMIGDALKGAFEGVTVIEAECYHYILDNQGNPVHCEDSKKLMEFQRRDGHVIAMDSFFCSHFHCQVKTSLVVHNPMVGNKVPKPRWITETVNIGTGDIKTSVSAETASSAMQFHRATCAAMKREIAKINKESDGCNE